jgi:hypothetical protein
MKLESYDNSQFEWYVVLRIVKPNRMELMDLSGSICGLIRKCNLYLRNPLEGVLDDSSSIDNKTIVYPGNSMRCSEMVEVVE